MTLTKVADQENIRWGVMTNNEINVCNGKGILIAFEGISGSGKSEGIQRLSNHLKSKGLATDIIEWNSNKRIRKIVKTLHKRKLLTANMYSILQWISFTLDYFIKIKPMLRKNKIVIADRYVYTALTRDVANGAGVKLSKMLMKHFRKPDLLFYCNTPPSVCLERIKTRGKPLFHTNKALYKDQTIVDKEAYYITNIAAEYENIFANVEVVKDTNIIYVHGDMGRMLQIVEWYIQNKKCLLHKQIIHFREE